MKNELEIEVVTSSDLADLVSLWKECELTRPWNDPHADVARALASPSSTVLVGRVQSAICASVMVGHDGHRGWMYYVGVAPQHRSKGYARAMVAAAEAWLIAAGAVKSMLMVRRSNKEALGFYAAIGYEESDVFALEKWLPAEVKAKDGLD